ncbi:DinB family protein [Virgibacillus siamensis]|uniref:DinB family protein n=1 Tax=Virgibacillus siamensis TaxID=480071 RepID=UPI0009841B5C|nr:DinB family protein [Virgibacillus siamensis]
MKLNERARTALLAEAEGVSDDNLNKQPAEDRWSMKQILEHLYLMEGTIAKIIKHQLEEGEERETSDRPIELTVNRSKKVEAPDFLQPSSDYAGLDDLVRKLEASHKQLAEIVLMADEQALKERIYPHPEFGQLSLEQWIPFLAYHEMRHTEQIKEVKQALNL